MNCPHLLDKQGIEAIQITFHASNYIWTFPFSIFLFSKLKSRCIGMVIVMFCVFALIRKMHGFL